MMNVIILLAIHTANVLSQTECSYGRFQYVNGECKFACVYGENYTSIDSLSFDVIMQECSDIELANLVDPKQCNSVSDLVWNNASCHCPYCKCSTSITAGIEIKTYDHLGYNPEIFCYECTCAKAHSWQVDEFDDMIYSCSSSVSATNFLEWEDYGTCPTNKCYSPYNETVVKGYGYYPYNYWFEVNEDSDLCEEFCYCPQSGDPICATGWENIMNHTELEAIFFTACNNPDRATSILTLDSAACYDIDTQTYDASRLFTIDGGPSCYNCPKCDCGEYNELDTWYVEYQVYNHLSEVDTAVCVQCTCQKDQYDDPERRLYAYCEENDFGEYEVGTVICDATNGITKIATDSDYSCHYQSYDTEPLKGTLNSGICSSETATNYCRWVVTNYTIRYYAGPPDLFSWYCGDAVLCEAFSDGECVYYDTVYNYTNCQGTNTDSADNYVTYYQYCCEGNNCNYEDIDVSTCTRSVEWENMNTDYHMCIYDKASELGELVCEDSVDAITCDDLLMVLKHEAGCWCAKHSVLYHRVSSKTQSVLKEQATLEMDSYNEWNEIFACNISLSCDLVTGHVWNGPETFVTTQDNSSIEEKAIEIKIDIAFGGELFFIIFGIAGVALFIAILCILYLFCFGGLLKRTGMPGTGTIKHTLKRMIPFGIIGVFIEIFDIATDYVYAVDLIGSPSDDVRRLGWVSLFAAIMGVLLFGMKILLTRKLVGNQITRLTEELSSATTAEKQKEIAQQIRKRIIDLDVMSLLMACCEDVPQALVVMIMRSATDEWTKPISILNLSLAVISFWWKLLQVLAAKIGCKDPNAGDKGNGTSEHMETEMEMQQLRMKYEKEKRAKERATSASYYSEDGDLGDGWRVAYTDDGKKYYQNDLTKQIKWERPDSTNGGS